MNLHDRLRRLEARVKRKSAPTQAEYDSARNHQRVRTLLSAFFKMLGEERSRRRLSEKDRALLEGDSEEQHKQDRDVIARYEEAHGVHYDLDTLAEQARQKLREVGRSE